MFEATDGSRLRYAWAAFVGFTTIAFFTAVGALVQLWGEKRLRNPLTWFRLVRLAVSMAFVLVPTLVLSALPGHHPRDFTDPIYLPAWLAQYDPETGTMPLWSPHGSTGSDRSATEGSALA